MDYHRSLDRSDRWHGGGRFDDFGTRPRGGPRWLCPSCGFLNRDTNQVCGDVHGVMGCKGPRPSDEELAAAKGSKGGKGGKGGGKGGRGGYSGKGRYGITQAGVQRGETVCMLHAQGRCGLAEPGAERCPKGRHLDSAVAPDYPAEDQVLAPVSAAKLVFVQKWWQDNGGKGQVRGVWQVYNKRLQWDWNVTQHNFEQRMRRTSDCIDAWHGTAEDNIFSIARFGFDPSRRSGQVHGEGEYFAKDPKVSVGYCKGGQFMFLCKLLLGQPGEDHTWVDSMKYYVVKQREGQVQALPLYVVQFGSSSSPLYLRLAALPPHRSLSGMSEELKRLQKGGTQPAAARWDAGMEAPQTKHLWLGWLEPSLQEQGDAAIEADVREHLRGYAVAQVIPELNGARVGAWVLLRNPISREEFGEISQRSYHGRFKISVDDEQPGNPLHTRKDCPRMCGPAKYCRMWNLKRHISWHEGCSHRHDPAKRATANAVVTLSEIPAAKYDDIQSQFMLSAPFHNGAPRIKSIKRVVNRKLEELYNERVRYVSTKHGVAVEKDLWHGTAVAALPEVLKHGLQPPSDTRPSDRCPRSGGKGLCTTLCDNSCEFCTEPHKWDRCHMFGLGVYLADMAKKSNRYVRPNPRAPLAMLFCKTLLGNPYLIEGNLLSKDAMHNFIRCEDPSDTLDNVAEEWNRATGGHHTYYVRGQGGGQKRGLGVENSEYIVFQPYEVLPLYLVEYELS